MIVISFDDRYGDVVFNFNEEELIKDGKLDKDKCSNIINKVTKVRNNINNDRVIMGFEPASDDDMMLFNIDSNGVQVSTSIV